MVSTIKSQKMRKLKILKKKWKNITQLIVCPTLQCITYILVRLFFSFGYYRN